MTPPSLTPVFDSGCTATETSDRDGRYRRVTTDQLTEATLDAMCQLAEVACPGVPARPYLESRLSRYPFVVLLGPDEGLLAFDFVDQFTENGEEFVYLGPIFSREGACVDLIVKFLESVVTEHPTSTVRVAAECQSPAALIMLSRLFGDRSFPVFGEATVPAEVRDAVSVFGRHLSHMGPINLDNLSTRSTETLFRPNPRFEPVVRWLLGRGVDVNRGDSQIFLATCHRPPATPSQTLKELNTSSRALSKGWSRRPGTRDPLAVANG